ncbi:MAG: DUF4157 domain-containing protein [Cyclobacteriaceae bacterium]
MADSNKQHNQQDQNASRGLASQTDVSLPTQLKADQRPAASTLAQLQALSHNGPKGQAMAQLQAKSANSPHAQSIAQLQDKANAAAAPSPGAKSSNSDLPAQLQQNMEAMSGVSLAGTKVHTNSSAPAQLNAHAYAQGSDIHLAPGQGQHLPHEAWHVVQQKQGRVQPTKQMKGKTAINDDAGLEKEADVMGAKAAGGMTPSAGTTQLMKTQAGSGSGGIVQRQLATDKLNVVGETHNESDLRRESEIAYTKDGVGHDAGYWQEHKFKLEDADDFGDPTQLRLEYAINKFITVIESSYKTNMKILPKTDPIVKNAYVNSLKKIIPSMIELCNTVIQTMAGQAKLYKNGTQQLTLSKKNYTILLKLFRGDIKKYINECSVFLNNYNDGNIDIDTFVDYVGVNFLMMEDPFKTVKGILDLKPDLQMRRSMAMNATANAGKDTLGVWKVGDLHVTDINNMHSNVRRYNLLSKATFNGLLRNHSKESIN